MARTSGETAAGITPTPATPTTLPPSRHLPPYRQESPPVAPLHLMFINFQSLHMSNQKWIQVKWLGKLISFLFPHILKIFMFLKRDKYVLLIFHS